MEPGLVSVLRSKLDEYNRSHGLYYEQAKGWPIDRKHGGDGAMLLQGATKEQRTAVATLIKKERDWTMIPLHRYATLPCSVGF